MSQLLSWMNMMAGLILFFSMSGISEWVMFATPQAKIFPFLLGVLLLGNAVFLALAKGETPCGFMIPILFFRQKRLRIFEGVLQGYFGSYLGILRLDGGNHHGIDDIIHGAAAA